MQAPQGRRFARSVFRAYLDELRRTGIHEQVRSGCSPELRALLDNPRDVPSWLDPAPFDEIAAAIFRLRGRNGVRELGYHVMKRGFTKVLEPIIHFALTFMGTSPSSLFNRASQMLTVFSRGIEMKWAPSGPAAGTMLVTSVHPIADLNWIAWEGTLVYGLELAGATGTVGEARPAADGRSCTIEVNWQAR